jgi:hypothetical protein
MFEEELTGAIYLMEREIIHLYRYGMSDSEKLVSVRDLFVFGIMGLAT